MAGLMFDVRDRLRSRADLLLQVEAAQDARQAYEALVLSPQLVSAVVSPMGGSGAPVRDIGMHVTQARELIFGVTLGLVSPGGFEQFGPAHDQVDNVLAGWGWHRGFTKPVEYRGGETLLWNVSAEGGKWLYRMRFSAFLSKTYEVQE